MHAQPTAQLPRAAGHRPSPPACLRRSEQSMCQMARCRKSTTCRGGAQQYRTKCPDLPDKMSATQSESVGLRKPHAECAPLAYFALRRDLATLTLHQRLTDGQTKAGSLAALRREERVEHLLHHVHAHADAGVGHFDDNARIAVPLGIQ